MPQDRLDLPDRFTTLRLETHKLRLSCGSEVLAGQQFAADQLCRMLSCAPRSYRRAKWLLHHSGRLYRSTRCLGGLVCARHRVSAS